MISVSVVCLVEDHAVVRAGFRRLLESVAGIGEVHEAASVQEGAECIRRHEPELLILDLSLPGVGGVEGLRRYLSAHPKLRVIVLTIHDNPLLAQRAIQAGAKAYVTKSSAAETLFEAIEAVMAGRVYLSSDVARAIAMSSLCGNVDPTDCLTPREFEIFQFLAEGKPVQVIADTLHLTPKTVSNYSRSIKLKLRVETTAELVHVAMRGRLLDISPDGEQS